LLIAVSRQSPAHGFVAGLITGIVYFTARSIDHARDGRVRRAERDGRGADQCRADRVLALFPAIFAMIVRGWPAPMCGC
jgi:hypothetical protein